MNHELMEVLRKLVASAPGTVAASASDWLTGKLPRQQLEHAIRQALTCPDVYSEESKTLMYRSLELLAFAPSGYYYGKLVRDQIPEMIRQQDETPVTRVLDHEEYLSELYRKLREETEEYIADENEEEIADILEVIEAICIAKGFSMDDVRSIKAKKRDARGGFEKRLYLISKD